MINLIGSGLIKIIEKQKTKKIYKKIKLFNRIKVTLIKKYKMTLMKFKTTKMINLTL